MKGLVIGAGVTGCYTATRLMEKGADVALLARGARADRLERDGLCLRDGLTGMERTMRPRIVRAPVAETFDYVMVCVQALHRAGLEPLLTELPGRPIVWFLGNTTTPYDHFAELLGRDRVLGGFPGVGGTWEGDVLVVADRREPGDEPFDMLVVGEAFPEAEPAAKAMRAHLSAVGMNVEHHVPIMAWHWCHVALVVPLAGALYRGGGDLEAVAGDHGLLEKAMRATRQAFGAVRRAGHPILPRRLHVMRFMPAGTGARRVAKLLQSPFGRIALAGHAQTARDEMRQLGRDLLALAGDDPGDELRELMLAI